MNIKFLELGLLTGIIDRDQLIKWSDMMLTKGNLENIFVELSSLRSSDGNNFILEILRKNSDDKLNILEFKKFHKLFLTHTFKTWDNPKKWPIIHKKFINYYNLNKHYLKEFEFEFWSRINDDYELRREGLTGCMKMPKELVKYFELYEINDDTDECILEVIYKNS